MTMINVQNRNELTEMDNKTGVNGQEWADVLHKCSMVQNAVLNIRIKYQKQVCCKLLQKQSITSLPTIVIKTKTVTFYLLMYR